MILQGDTREVMRKLISEGVKVQSCVTSPPYWGLRDYGHKGQIGLEDSPEEYVANMVEVFSLVKELLNDDGTLWLNLGDSYIAGATGTNCQNASTLGGGKDTQIAASKRPNKSAFGLKPKNLVGIPWRVAFALQADGWYLRSDIIWSKPNPMPESVTDRPTKSHEYIFLLSKSSKYYYDHEAIKEPASTESLARMERGVSGTHKNINGAPGQSPHSMNAPRQNKKQDGHGRRHKGFNERWDEKTKYNDKDNYGGGGSSFKGHSGYYKADGTLICGELRNKRSVWTISTKPYSEAHFATYPSDLIEPCILAGSKDGDIILDPFNGSGTTGLVAMQNRRKYIGIEINQEYIALSEKRLKEIEVKLL